MKRILSAFAVLALATATAQAADYPTKAPAKQATAELFNWSGWYIGANAGYSKPKFESSGLSDSPSGAAFGIQGGYRYHFNNNIVAGIEADITAGDLSGNTATIVSDSAKLFGTVRATLGYAFTGFMLYGTAGYAWQRGEVGILGFTDSQMHGGWAYGGGIASPITPHLIASVEYIHLDLSDKTYTIPLGSANVSSSNDIVRAKLDYKF